MIMFIKQTLLHGLIIITSMVYTDILVVHAKIKRKCFFVILPSHPHTYPGKSLFIGISSVRVSVRVKSQKTLSGEPRIIPRNRH